MEAKKLMGIASVRRLWIVYYVYILSSIPVFSWYDRMVLLALLNPSTDIAGNLVFSAEGSEIYPFTIASAALGVALTTILVWSRAGGMFGLLVGVLVARATMGAMVELYELTFVSIGYFFHGWKTLEEHFLPNLDWALLKAGYISVLAPWVKRENVRILTVLTAVTLLLFFIWSAMGYKLPASGDIAGYALNAATRSLFSVIPAMGLMDRRIFSLCTKR